MAPRSTLRVRLARSLRWSNSHLRLLRANTLEQREIVGASLDRSIRLFERVAQVLDEEIANLSESPCAMLGYYLTFFAIKDIDERERRLVPVVSFRGRVQGDYELKRQVGKAQHVPCVTENRAALLGEGDALISELVREDVAWRCDV